MLDRDLAELYGVKAIRLREQVKCNNDRFPENFMMQLTEQEVDDMVSQNAIPSNEYSSLRSQNGTLKQGAHAKYLPMAFTEQGVAMLSSVLNSARAIKVNIQIIRTFTHIRKLLSEQTELRLEVEKIKKKLDNQDKNMEVVFQYLDELLEKKDAPQPERKSIGYKISKDK